MSRHGAAALTLPLVLLVATALLTNDGFVPGAVAAGGAAHDSDEMLTNMFQNLLGDFVDEHLQKEEMLLSTGWAVDLIDLFRFPVIDAGPRPDACKECFNEYMGTGESILRNQTLSLCSSYDAKMANATDTEAKANLAEENVEKFCAFGDEHTHESTVVLSYHSRSDPVRLATQGCGFSCGHPFDPFELDKGLHLLDGVKEHLSKLVHEKGAMMPNDFDWDEDDWYTAQLPEVANITCAACMNDQLRFIGEDVVQFVKSHCDDFLLLPAAEGGETTKGKYCEWARDNPRASAAAVLYSHKVNPLHVGFAMCSMEAHGSVCPQPHFIETGPGREECRKLIGARS